jgi:hypothetical protein
MRRRQIFQDVSSRRSGRRWAPTLGLRSAKGLSGSGAIWTGLACLKANPKVKNFRRFGKGKGAYVNIAAWAESKAAFEEKVKRHTKEMDCVLVELEDVQLLESRMKLPDFPEEFINMRQTANRQQADTVFGTFHIWMQEESN